MSYNKYTAYLLSAIALLLFCVAVTNYTIDPASIYRSSENDDNSPKAYAEQLIQSKHGLLWPNDSWSEREIKRHLASSIPNKDCAVIGSSRVMYISSHLDKVMFQGSYDSIVNLGVSGGTLEDYIALSWELLNNPSRPKNIMFGIDPWALNWRQDSRWGSYKNSYDAMRSKLTAREFEDSDNSSTTLQALQNLINLDYFQRSISMIGEETHIITEAPNFEPNTGIEHPLFRPDGSLVYSREVIQKTKDPERKIVPGDYKINEYGPTTTPGAVQLFTKLVEYIQSQGIEVHFVLIPYHQSVWTTPQSRVVQVISEVESFILQLGKDLNAPVWGSYNPEIVGCGETEFFDYMHPQASCLVKLRKRKAP